MCMIKDIREGYALIAQGSKENSLYQLGFIVGSKSVFAVMFNSIILCNLRNGHLNM